MNPDPLAEVTSDTPPQACAHAIRPFHLLRGRSHTHLNLPGLPVAPSRADLELFHHVYERTVKKWMNEWMKEWAKKKKKDNIVDGKD